MFHFNIVFLQADATKIGELNGQIKRLLKTFLSKFVQTLLLQKYVELQDIPYGDEENQYIIDDIVDVGLDTRFNLSEVEDVLSPLDSLSW